MFIYQTNPIDYFCGLVPIVTAIKQIQEEDMGSGDGDGQILGLFKFAMACSKLVATAKGSWWEGDIGGQYLYVFSLPDPERTSYRFGLVWKQGNNGTSYICSPVPLPWIPADEILLQP